ncbi:MAG TPA: ABC transporter permease [Pseudonocardiaceae bacterium]|nr:ABC transporter permease [Pseudonocardiaceae bacterium]
MVTRRVLEVPGVLAVSSVLVFLLPQLTGTDTARAALRARSAESTPDAATVARVTHEFGLDRSLPEQYLSWLGHALTGDFGLSFTTRTAVGPQVLRATSVSLTLVVLALVLAAGISVPAGVYAAAHRGRLFDKLVSAASVLGVAVPEFILGPGLVLVFSVTLGLLPTTGWRTPSDAVLPTLSLTAFPAALVAQLTRAEMLDALGRPYIVVARAKGLGEQHILWRHAARTALTSVLALSSVFFAGLLGVAVIAEVIFAIPGLGRLLYDAVLAQDLPMTQAGLLAVITLALLARVTADLLQLVLNPQAREAQR